MKKNKIFILSVILSLHIMANDLNKAIESGLRTKVNMLLEKKLDVNEIDEMGDTAIDVAILKKDEAIFDLIIEKNPNLNIKNFKGQTPLQLAIENKFDYGINKLINKSQDLEIKDIDGKTALFYAVNNQDKELIDALIKKGANINCTDNQNNTILHILCKNDNNLELVKYFLDKHIDINLVNSDKKTALHTSIENKSNKIAELLINSNININSFDKNRQTALHLSVINNSTVIRTLLEKRVALDTLDNNNKTAFDYLNSKKEISQIWSSSFKNECLKDDGIKLNEFLQYSSNFYYYLDMKEAIDNSLNSNNKEQYILLAKFYKDLDSYFINTIIENNISKIKKILEYSNTEDIKRINEKESLINLAVKYKNLDVIKQLSTLGFNLNEKDKSGNTPLISSIYKNYDNITKFLIENNADINGWNDILNSPLKIAIDKENFQIAELLVSKGSKFKDSKHNSLVRTFIGLNKTSDTFNFFSNKNIDLNETDASGITYLHDAVIKKDINAFEFLLSQKVNLNIKDSLGKTPLHYAIEENYTYAIKKLVIYGADVKIKDNDSKMAFEYASDETFKMLDSLWINTFWEGIKENKIELINLAINNGISIATISSNGNTALIEAINNNSKDAIAFLISKGAFDKNALIELLKKDDADNFISLYSSINLDNKAKSSLIFKSIEIKAIRVINKLAELNTDFDILNEKNKSPLMLAILNKNNDLITLFLDKSKNLEIKDENGKTALFYATDILDMKLTKRLIEKGAKVNQVDNLKNNILMYSVQKDNNLDLTKYLVTTGINLNQKNTLGKNALLISGENKAIKTLNFLISCGMDVNATNNDGETLLFLATRWNNENFARYLLEKEINVSILSNKGYRASQYADGDLAEIIENYWTDTLISALHDGDFNLFKKAYELGADYTYKDEESNNIYLIAVSNNNTDIVSYLLGRGFRINFTNYAGNSALHLAIYNGNTNLAKFLISKGIDSKAANNYGKTPLNLAIEYNNLVIANLLMKKLNK